MIELISRALFSFTAVLGGALIINTPKRFLLPTSFGGLICWGVYLWAIPFSNNIIANFWSAICVALYSQLMARIYKTPNTIFFIPGFLPIVPGFSFYRSVYYYISGNNDKFYYHLSETFQTAALIAIAIFIVDMLFKLHKRIQHKHIHKIY